MWGKKELFTGPMGLQRHQLVNISQVYLCPVTLLYSYLQFKGKDNKRCIFHYWGKHESLIFALAKVSFFFNSVINMSMTMKYSLNLAIALVYELSVLHLLHI